MLIKAALFLIVWGAISVLCWAFAIGLAAMPGPAIGGPAPLIELLLALIIWIVATVALIRLLGLQRNR